MTLKLRLTAPTEGARALSETVRGRRSHRPGPTHDHVFDGSRRFAIITSRYDSKGVRKVALLDEANFVVVGIEPNRAEMTSALPNFDFHEKKSLAGLFRRSARAAKAGRLTDPYLRRLVLSANLLVGRMLPQILEIRVRGHPVEITVAGSQSPLQSQSGQVDSIRQRVTASQIVMNGGITRLQLGQAFIDLKPLRVIAPAGVIVSQQLKGVDKVWIAFHDPSEKLDFDIQVAFLLRS